MRETKKTSLAPRLRFPEFRDEPGWDALNGNKLFDPIDRRPAAPGLPILAITQEHGAIPRDQIDYHVSVSETSIASYKEVRPADFIISLRSFQGGIEYSKFNGICSPAYIVLKRKGDGEDHFFRHLFKSDRFIQQLTRNIEGLRDGKMISFKQFSEQLLPSPSPAEQRKIAACLGSLDEWIGAESAKLEALRSHKKGLMQQLFPRPGESRPRLRFPEFHTAGEWEERPMAKVSTIVRGGSPRPIDGFLTTATNGLNWLKIGDVEDGAKYVTRTEQKVRPEALSKTRVIRPGDFILSNSMSFGRPYISQIETCIHDGWIAVTQIETGWDHEFLYYVIMSERSQMYFENQAAGGGVRNLTTDIVKALPLAYCGLAEQQRIAACLSSLDVLLSAASRKVEALKQHKKGLMQQLFPSGEG